MIFRKAIAVLLTAGTSFSSGVALAHHSFAMFDQERTVEIKGTVKDYQWTQPHVWLDVMVMNKQGKLERWGIENQSPAILFERGWRIQSLKVGDKVTVQLHPMKDGTNGGVVMRVTLPDGKVLSTNFAERKVLQ